MPLAAVALAASLGLAGWAAATGYRGMVRVGWSRSFEDLTIYRDAAIAAWSAHDVYDLRLSWAHLPFTYPPFAILVLGWTALLTERAAQLTMLAVNALLLLVGCLLSCRTAGGARSRTWVLTAGLVAAAVGCCLDPVLATVGFGQVNLLVMVLVLVDCLLVPPRWRGLLTGAATSLKLTPGIFVVYFLCSGQRRAAYRQVVGVLATSLLAAVVLPDSSRTYWTGVVTTNRAGRTTYASNQSWSGLVDRLVHDRGVALTATLALDAATVVVAALAVRGCTRRGAPLSAVCVTALAGLLVSPISWSHHWVWLVPLLVALAVEQPFRGGVPAAVGLVAVFRAPPLWRVPHGFPSELHWDLHQTLLGDRFCLAAAAVLVGTAVGTRRGRRSAVQAHPQRAPVASPRPRQPPARAPGAVVRGTGVWPRPGAPWGRQR